MAEIKLIAEARSEFGKGAARRIRREDKIPAVLYGHGTEPLHIVLEGHATMMALKHTNAIVELESGDGSKNELAIAREIQRHPLKRTIEHVDFIIVKRGEKIEVEVPLDIQGEAQPGTMVSIDTNTVLISADALKLPDTITVSIEGRGIGEHVHASDVELPAGSELISEPETLLINISEAPAEEDEASEEAASEEA